MAAQWFWGPGWPWGLAVACALCPVIHAAKLLPSYVALEVALPGVFVAASTPVQYICVFVCSFFDYTLSHPIALFALLVSAPRGAEVFGSLRTVGVLTYTS